MAPTTPPEPLYTSGVTRSYDTKCHWSAHAYVQLRPCAASHAVTHRSKLSHSHSAPQSKYEMVDAMPPRGAATGARLLSRRSTRSRRHARSGLRSRSIGASPRGTNPPQPSAPPENS